MLLKIMSAEDAGDDDSRKTFRILDNVEAAEFARDAHEAAFVSVTFTDGETEDFPCPSNVYLMNHDGKTVAHFGGHPLR